MRRLSLLVPENNFKFVFMQDSVLKSEKMYEEQLTSYVLNYDFDTQRSPSTISHVSEQTPANPPTKKLQTEEICNYIKTEQWEKLVPFVDELITQITNGTVSVKHVSGLLKSTTCNCEIAKKNLFIDNVVKTVTVLLKDIIICMASENTTDVLGHAKRIRDILLTAQGISTIASEENLSSLLPSEIIQIDTIKGRPIYALK